MNNTKIILSILGLLAYTALLAQPPSPPATPIDGGLSLLLLGGAAYGIKKIMKAKNRH
ncbi:MAG: hypothetical protein RIA69_18390 [Cyclobacteriaceae bacterium]